MLHYAVIFFVIAIIAAVLGFSGIAGAASNIAWILFVVFLILAVVSLLRGLAASELRHQSARPPACGHGRHLSRRPACPRDAGRTGRGGATGSPLECAHDRPPFDA